MQRKLYTHTQHTHTHTHTHKPLKYRRSAQKQLIFKKPGVRRPVAAAPGLTIIIIIFMLFKYTIVEADHDATHLHNCVAMTINVQWL